MCLAACKPHSREAAQSRESAGLGPVVSVTPAGPPPRGPRRQQAAVSSSGRRGLSPTQKPRGR